jgi:protein gp37
MFHLDSQRGKDGALIYKVQSSFDRPLKRNRRGDFVIPPGSTIRVCMTSDFFLEEADEWRGEVWKMIEKRSDVLFYLLTKRIERVKDCLPENWGDGWENVWMNVSAENQKMADRRIPLLLDLPFKHRGIMAAPLIGEIDLKKHLSSGKIERVIVGGENYDGARECHYEWVHRMHQDCVDQHVNFEFIETGNHFVKNGRKYEILDKRKQQEQAKKSGLSYEGRAVSVQLTEVAQGESVPLFQTDAVTLCDSCAYKKFCGTQSGRPSCMLSL